MASLSTLDLDSLFSVPSRFPPSPLCPPTLAGHSDDSVQTLRSLLKLNYQSHHIFVNERNFHSHMLHHLFTKFALGANSTLLRAIYDYDKAIQLPATPSPGPITPENYVDYLGDPKYYQSYYVFFARRLQEKGVSKTLEEYIYSKKANYDDQHENNQPKMFSRFVGGLYHPMIHLGYGLEFGMAGVVAGALAEAAVHKTPTSPLIPTSSWDDEESAEDIDNFASRMSSLGLSYAVPELTGTSPAPSSRTEEVSFFNILAMIQKDDSMTTQALGINENTSATVYEVMEKLQGPLLKYANMWTLNIIGSSNVQREVERKLEEIAFAGALMYGIGGWSEGPFRADFALMHLVTSSVFLPAIVVYFPPHAIQLFLRTHLCTVLALWITKRKPALRIKEFMTSTSVSPQDPNGSIKSSHKPVKDTLTPEIVNPNPWLALVQSVLEHPDEHLCKIMRSLMHWGNLFGSRPVGYWAEGKVQLEGIEALDGTLFLRVAGLTMGELGWVKEGQDPGQWDHSLPPGMPARVYAAKSSQSH